MTQEFIAFKVIACADTLTFDKLNAYTDPNYKGDERMILEQTSNIESMSEKAHGCYKLILKNSINTYMLSPSEAKKVIETLTRSYKK